MPKKRKLNNKRQTRVRSKRLDQLDESKLALAFWLLAKQMASEDDERQSDKPEQKAGAP